MPQHLSIPASVFGEAERELDRWVVGEAVDSDHRYIFHLRNPKLLARVLDPKPNGNRNFGITGGLSFPVGDTTFYDIAFFDEPPSTAHEMNALFREAEAALQRHRRGFL